jgi:hypothetical protein
MNVTLSIRESKILNGVLPRPDRKRKLTKRLSPSRKLKKDVLRQTKCSKRRRRPESVNGKKRCAKRRLKSGLKNS